MPRTPAAVRPIGRTSRSLKRIALPLLATQDARRCEPSVIADADEAILVAQLDGDDAVARGREKAVERRLLRPCRALVAMNTNCLPRTRVTGSTALMRSPASSGSRFTIRRAARAARRLRQLVRP